MGMDDIADLIKQEYDESGCDRRDLEHATKRLLAECADEFENEEAAVAFLHDA
jgi:hypothetical protein